MPRKKSLEYKTSIFKNKPLVRCENTIYYGNVSDKYIIKLEILSEKPLCDTTISDKISVQLLSTDPELSSRKKIIKKCEKNGLYEAMDIAEAWLCKALEEQ